ncbi:transcription initiation factor TFIID subunit 10 [Parasteatoda tepidariorum]|nr:transcription initiation factor TFIID subunit 10 [Parasteatoda tepidariorum]
MALNTTNHNEIQPLIVKTDNDLPTSSSALESNPSSPVQIPGRTMGDSLCEFIDQLEDYTPTVPEPVVKHFLKAAGAESTDPRVSRLIALAAEKFISDIANDALQHCKMRGAGQSSKKAAKDKRYVLSMEDLTPALADYGINGKKPHYFA